MAKNVAKKVAGFVANEMLGIDDIKRAVKYAKKGDVKKALKSAGTAAFELGTTASIVGKAPAVAVKVAGKTVTKQTEKTAAKAADKVAQKVAEKLPTPKYGKKGGEVKTVRTDPKEDIVIRRDVKGDYRTTPGKKVAVDKPKSATYTTRENTQKQRAAVEKRMRDERNRKINEAGSAAYKAVKGPVSKSLASSKVRTAATAYTAGKAVKDLGTQKNHHVTKSKNFTKKSK